MPCLLSLKDSSPICNRHRPTSQENATCNRQASQLYTSGVCACFVASGERGDMKKARRLNLRAFGEAALPGYRLSYDAPRRLLRCSTFEVRALFSSATLASSAAMVASLFTSPERSY